MPRNTVSVYPVTASNSYLVQVNQLPVYQTSDLSRAKQMAERLNRLFADDLRGPSSIQSTYANQQYVVWCPAEQTAILEFDSADSPDPQLESLVVAQNIRRAVHVPASFEKMDAANEPTAPLRPPMQTDTPDNGENQEEEQAAEVEEIYLHFKPVLAGLVVVEHVDQQYIYQGSRSTRYGDIILVRKPEKKGKLYAIIRTGNQEYMIKRAVASSLALETTRAYETAVFGKHLVRLDGIFGANSLKNHYLEIHDGTVRLLVTVWGNVMEFDIDRDGTKEIVAFSGTPPITRIYKSIDGVIHYCRLNADANAFAVFPSEGDPTTFQVYFTPQSEPVLYRYESDKLLRVDS